MLSVDTLIEIARVAEEAAHNARQTWQEALIEAAEATGRADALAEVYARAAENATSAEQAAEEADRTR